MAFVSHSPPNFAAAKSAFGIDQGPIMTSKFTSLPLFLKASLPFILYRESVYSRRIVCFLQVNGIMNMVFAYGGAMIFPEMVRSYVHSSTRLQTQLRDV